MKMKLGKTRKRESREGGGPHHRRALTNGEGVRHASIATWQIRVAFPVARPVNLALRPRAFRSICSTCDGVGRTQGKLHEHGYLQPRFCYLQKLVFYREVNTPSYQINWFISFQHKIIGALLKMKNKGSTLISISKF